MKTRCLIVDDEPLARDLIRSHLEKLDNFEVVAECADAIKALQVLREHQVNLMFLDIQMPQITGLDLLRTLTAPPKVIITTAYREYALDGYELDVVDYLLKPVTFERFLKAVNKYFQMKTEQTMLSPDGREEAAGQENSYIYVKENKRIVKVLLNDIVYIEGLSEYVQIYTDKKRIITKMSMTQMEEKLPSGQFLRIHKSYIVAVSRIEAFTANIIEIPRKELPIGRSYKSVVLTALNFIGNIGS